MTTRSLLIVVFLASGTCLFAQTRQEIPQKAIEPSALLPEQSDVQITKSLYNELEGTYEVIFSNPDHHVLYTRTFLETIKSSRSLDDIVTIQWDEFTSVNIFPFGSLEIIEEQ